MNTMYKFNIETLSFPIEGNKYNLQVLTITDGGRTFYYCGIGRFCKDMDEVNAMKDRYERTGTFRKERPKDYYELYIEG